MFEQRVTDWAYRSDGCSYEVLQKLNKDNYLTTTTSIKMLLLSGRYGYSVARVKITGLWPRAFELKTSVTCIVLVKSLTFQCLTPHLLQSLSFSLRPTGLLWKMFICPEKLRKVNSAWINSGISLKSLLQPL